MSPRFYAILWVVFFLAALTCWVAGIMSLLTLVVFGFIAFGMVFAGMMCVLPTQVAHEHEEEVRIAIEKPKPVRREAKVEKQTAPAGALRHV